MITTTVGKSGSNRKPDIWLSVSEDLGSPGIGIRCLGRAMAIKKRVHNSGSKPFDLQRHIELVAGSC